MASKAVAGKFAGKRADKPSTKPLNKAASKEEAPEPLSSFILHRDKDPAGRDAPEERVGSKSRGRACHTTRRELSFSGIRKAFLKFWLGIPEAVWGIFVQALYIPAYRWEWHRYRRWSLRAHGKGVPADPESKVPGKKKQESFQDTVEKHKGCRRLVFNVSGVRYETQLRTLDRFPKTLLGNHESRIRYWDPENHEYFLDRHPGCFESILHFYQTNGVRLERPHDIPLHVFEDEVRFYELGRKEINRLMDEEGFELVRTKDLPDNLFQRKVWLLLEYPDSSKQARIFSYVTISAISLSTVEFCLETLGHFNPSQGPSTQVIDLKDVFFVTETICLAFFTLEFIVRLVVSPDKGVFLRSLTNIIDFVAILPYYIQITIALSGDLVPSSPLNTSYIKIDKGSHLDSTFRMLKAIRAFRILKFSRFSKGLRILGLTLRASLQELGLLCFFLAVGVILFSSALYFAENGPGSRYTSIPYTFYWGVCTMTTLGSGADVPVTFIGKIVGSLCAVTGVLTLSLPVPVIVANFNYFYHRETDDMRQRMVGPSQYVKSCPFRPTCRADDNEGQEEDENFRLPGEKELLNLSSDEELDNHYSSFDSIQKEPSQAEMVGPDKEHRQSMDDKKTSSMLEQVVDGRTSKPDKEKSKRK